MTPSSSKASAPKIASRMIFRYRHRQETLLNSLPRFADSDYVFTANGHKHVTAWWLAKEKLDAMVKIEPWRVHDLRRTVATGLQRLGVGLQVIETVLGHVGGSRSGVVGTYQRHSFQPEARAALEAWGAHVIGLIEGRPQAQGGTADAIRLTIPKDAEKNWLLFDWSDERPTMLSGRPTSTRILPGVATPAVVAKPELSFSMLDAGYARRPRKALLCQQTTIRAAVI